MTDETFPAPRDKRLTDDEVVAQLRAILPDLPEEAFARVLVEPPRDPSHGDMATNAARVVAKQAKLPPPKLAAELAARLAASPLVAEATPAGPGFVNLRLREDPRVGGEGKVLAESRDLDALRARFGAKAGQAFAAPGIQQRDVAVEAFEVEPRARHGRPVPLAGGDR